MSAGPSSVASAKLLATAVEIGRSQRTGVERASFAMKQRISAEASRASGGDGRLSGAKDARISVRYDVKGERNPTALIRALGPWQLVEFDTNPHFITSRRGGGSRRSRAARLGGSGSRTLRGVTITTAAGNTLAFTSGDLAAALGSSRRRNTSGRLGEALGVEIVDFRRTRITEGSTVGFGPVAPGAGSGLGGRGGIDIKGVGWRRYARHPGTRGKRPWARGRDRGLPEARKELLLTSLKALRKVWT